MPIRILKNGCEFHHGHLYWAKDPYFNLFEKDIE